MSYIVRINSSSSAIFGLPAQDILPGQSKGEQLQLTEGVQSAEEGLLKEGYRIDNWHNEQAEKNIPVLAVAVHRDKLIDIFIEFIDLLDGRLDLVLETSHEYEHDKHRNCYRENIEKYYLKDIIYEHSDLFLKDGKTGITILNPEIPEEIQFDEHKCLFVYSEHLERFQEVLERYGIPCENDLLLISQTCHMHLSTYEYEEQFQRLAQEVGVSEDPGEDEELFSN